MKLVNDDYTVNATKFKCLVTNKVYELVNSRCTGRKSFNVVDTLCREDGVKRDFTRFELTIRFKNIEIL